MRGNVLNLSGPLSRSVAVPLPLTGFIVVAALVALPILAHPYLPLVDLPNHIARLYIEAHQGGPLSEYYRYAVRLVPNTAADLAWYVLGFPGDVVRFAQWAMVFYAVGLVAATMLLARQIHGRWTLWSAASGLIVYNACFYWGFQNYLISLPFALTGLALWLATERWRRLPRLVFFCGYGFGLFVLHFYAFAALAFLAFGHEVQRTLEAPKGQRAVVFARRLPMALPFALPTAWLAIHILTGPPSASGSRTLIGTFSERVEGLLSPAVMAGNWLGMPTKIAGLLVFAFLFLCVYFLRRRLSPRLTLSPIIFGPAATILVVSLIAPFWLNGVAFSNIRWPLVGVLVLIAGSDWHGLSRRGAAGLSLCVVALLGLRAISFERAARSYSADVADYLAATQALPPGARLLPLRAPGKMWDERMWHFNAYAVTRRDAFVPLLFQGVHELQVLPQWRERTSAQSFPPDIRIAKLALRYRLVPGFLNNPLRRGTAVPQALPVVNRIVQIALAHYVDLAYLSDWPSNFNYALLLDPDRSNAGILPQLHEIAHRGRFTLYRIDPDGRPATNVAKR